MKKVLLILSLFMAVSHAWCQVTYYSKASATDFTSTASWGDVADGSGAAPASISSSSIFIIANGSVMNLNTGNAEVRKLTISSGSLTIGSNTLTVSIGASNNNTFFVVNGGSFTISGGSLVVNGAIAIATNSSFHQSGGTIIVDSNSGTAATSIANRPTFGLGYLEDGSNSSITTATNYTMTGGTLRIVDPPLNATPDALAYYSTTTHINWGLSHTLELGDGSSTTAGGHAGGFNIHGARGGASGRLTYGNLSVNAATNASNRHVTMATSSGFRGNVTINTNTELRGTTGARMSIARDLTNDGILVIPGTATLAFESYLSTVSTATSSAQTVSGSGTFKNAVTGETANVARLTIYNSNASGVTFNNSSTEFTVSGILTMTAGIVTMGTGSNTLTLGIAGTPGTYTYAAGRIVGKLKRFVSAAIGTYIFNIGTSTTARTATIDFTGAPTGAGALTASFTATSPGIRNLPQTFDIAVETVSPTGFWTVESTATGGTYTASFNAVGFTKTDGTTALGLANTRLIKGATGGSTYTAASTGTPSGFTAISITGQTTFSDFAVGGTNGAVLPIEFQSITAAAKGNANLISWATAREKDVAEFAIERSANNQTWAVIGTKKAVGGQQTTPYTFVDNAPLALNYYRIRSIELDNKTQVSKVVAVKRNGGKLALNAAFPMPITEGVTLDFSTSKAGKITAILTDILGKVVKTDIISANEGSNTVPLNVANLAKGTYILTLNDGETRVNQRLVKQ